MGRKPAQNKVKMEKDKFPIRYFEPLDPTVVYTCAYGLFELIIHCFS